VKVNALCIATSKDARSDCKKPEAYEFTYVCIVPFSKQALTMNPQDHIGNVLRAVYKDSVGEYATT
jgi:hypothetical protein